MNSLIAVRSLQCPDHAYNIPPTVLSVNWNVTKRCNYDCSYCNSFTHDSVSPFIDINLATKFIEFCESYCGASKKIKWALTGGEPFLDPNILEFLKLLHGKHFTEQINVVTNGTLPLSLYRQASDYLKGITISLHFERQDAEIDKIVDTILALNKDNTCQISVNVMFLPKNTDRILNVINRLKLESVSYVVRKIAPIDKNYTDIKPYDSVDNKRKSIILKSEDTQRTNKQTWRILNDTQVFENIDEYYTLEESKLIESLMLTNPVWQNAGVWNQNGDYQEVNTDQLVATHQNSFKNWICYAGVDSVYIDWDGSIYRGMCLDGGPIGNIRTGNYFVSNTPTICQTNRCFCNSDIAVRKCSSKQFESLIT